MGKKGQPRDIIYGRFPSGEQPVDSYEEKVFSHWCYILWEKGWISDYTKGNTYILSEKVTYNYMKKLKTKHKEVDSHLMFGHEYTPDFTIRWNDKAKYVFFCPISYMEKSYDFSAPMMAQYDNGDWVSIIEVKPIFDQNNMERLATINIKWVYNKYEIYIDLIHPMPKMKNGLPASTLFRQTFFPPEALLTPKDRKERKIGFKHNTYEQFISERLRFVESITPIEQNSLF